MEGMTMRGPLMVTLYYVENLMFSDTNFIETCVNDRNDSCVTALQDEVRGLCKCLFRSIHINR